MLKESIQQEYKTCINIYAPNIKASKYMNQTLAYIKGEINSNKVIKGGFNTPLTSINRPSRQKYQPHKTC